MIPQKRKKGTDPFAFHFQNILKFPSGSEKNLYEIIKKQYNNGKVTV